MPTLPSKISHLSRHSVAEIIENSLVIIQESTSDRPHPVLDQVASIVRKLDQMCEYLEHFDSLFYQYPDLTRDHLAIAPLISESEDYQTPDLIPFVVNAVWLARVECAFRIPQSVKVTAPSAPLRTRAQIQSIASEPISFFLGEIWTRLWSLDMAALQIASILVWLVARLVLSKAAQSA